MYFFFILIKSFKDFTTNLTLSDIMIIFEETI